MEGKHDQNKFVTIEKLKSSLPLKPIITEVVMLPSLNMDHFLSGLTPIKKKTINPIKLPSTLKIVPIPKPLKVIYMNKHELEMATLKLPTPNMNGNIAKNSNEFASEELLNRMKNITIASGKNKKEKHLIEESNLNVKNMEEKSEFSVINSSQEESAGAAKELLSEEASDFIKNIIIVDNDDRLEEEAFIEGKDYTVEIIDENSEFWPANYHKMENISAMEDRYKNNPKALSNLGQIISYIEKENNFNMENVSKESKYWKILSDESVCKVNMKENDNAQSKRRDEKLTHKSTPKASKPQIMYISNKNWHH